MTMAVARWIAAPVIFLQGHRIEVSDLLEGDVRE
jgi:hypothetical protein